MRLHLVGPRQGQTVRLGGFQFKNGSIEIPDSASEAQSLLANFHNAHPEGKIQRGEDGKLELLPSLAPAAENPEDETDPVHLGSFLPPPESVQGLNDAGGVEEKVPNAPPAGKQPKK